MNILDTIAKQVTETEDKIAQLYYLERNRIHEINSISAGDVRGQTPEVSDRIRQLDAERRNVVDTRRKLTSELAVAKTMLDKARIAYGKNKK